MSISEFPILEFDPEREAFIEPSRVIKPIDIPQRCIICFFKEAIDSLVASLQWSVVWNYKKFNSLKQLWYHC